MDRPARLLALLPLLLVALLSACEGGGTRGDRGPFDLPAADPAADIVAGDPAAGDPAPDRVEPDVPSDPAPEGDEVASADAWEAGDLPPADLPGDRPADVALDGPPADATPDVAPCECPEDDDPCTKAACGADGACLQVPLTGDPCDDGSPCTDPDQCILGACTGRPLSCDDGDPCTQDRCEAPGGCIHLAREGEACDDGSACTAGDTCRDGTCLGDPVACDDGQACTRDACDPASGCLHAPMDGPACDDGSACTTDDRCRAGTCAGDPIACDDGNPCTRDLCDLAAGCLHVPSDGAACNDGNPCTDTDRCVQGACLGRSAACDDGNPCTLDGCTLASGCIHTQPPGLPCDDGDACTAGDRCYQGACLPGLRVDCDDRNPCTEDACEPSAGCLHAAVTGGGCDDGNACTAGERCQGGLCRGTPVSCDDANPCTADSCDPATGCVHAATDGTCDDGDPCTAGDACSGGACLRGWNPQCLAVRRIVLAGDSWSTGFILPLRDALDARGYEEVTVSWERTSKPGSTARTWVTDASFTEALYTALDQEPPAEMLVFTLGGNDFLAACNAGLAVGGWENWFYTMSYIQRDLQSFLNLARSGHPDLKIVFIGYDYLSLPMINALGTDLPGMDWVTFNLALVDLSGRQRDLASGMSNTVYAHNLGTLQHVFGDPLFGYGPGEAPRPGPAPAYDPFPGGWYTYPSPAAHIPDGIHPDPAGFRALIENTLDQGMAAWIEGRPWP